MIVANSPAMKTAMDAVRAAVARHDGVLVCGEPGSGRRTVARELHRLALGPDAPFVEVDCPGEGDLEMAVFGVAAASSSGNGRERSGLDRVSRASQLGTAATGTLCLANVAEMPARLQARLVRVLRDGEVAVAEAGRTVPVKPRLIVVSDCGWDAAIDDGRIRADLGKRCSSLRVEVPPLRQRREDIAALAQALLDEACAAQGLGPIAIPLPAQALLAALPWQGNARELRSLLENLAPRVPSGQLRVEDILSAVQIDGTARTVLANGTLREAREHFERDYIVAALERHRGRIGEAASALGIQRPNLYRKMRALRVPPPRAAHG
jgi:DNA-binding NtrC family response regulator